MKCINCEFSHNFLAATPELKRKYVFCSMINDITLKDNCCKFYKEVVK